MRLIFLSALLFFSALQLHAQFDVTESKWQTPVIDGSSADWPKPFHLYEPNTGIMFAFSNDSTHLYICFESNEKLKIRKLMSAGWKMEISDKEKKDKFSASITFPSIQRMETENKKETAENGSDMSKQKFNFEDFVGGYRLRMTQVTTEGFVSKNGIQPVQDASGITIAVGTDNAVSESIVYEIAIPLKEIPVKNILDVKELMLDVTVNAIERTEGMNSGSYSKGGGSGFHGGGGGDGGGKGMGGGGGHHGGGGGGGGGGQGYGSADKSALFDKASFKQKFKLNKG